MFKQFYTTFFNRYGAVLIYCLAALGLSVMYVGLYPSLQTQSQQYADIFNAFPESFMKAFGLSSAQGFLFSLESFIATEHFSLIWPILAIILSLSLAANNLVEEIERGTMEFLLSLPVSRLKLYFARYLSGAFFILIFTAISIFSIILGAKIFDVSYMSDNYLKLFYIASLFSLAIYSIAMFFSALLSEKSKVYAVSVAIVIVMYIINIISALKDKLSDLQYLSFFHYFNASNILVRGEVDNHSIWVFALTTLVFFIAGAIVFDDRDIATT